MISIFTSTENIYKKVDQGWSVFKLAVADIEDFKSS